MTASSQAPIFQSVLGTGWDAMPRMMRRRYAVRPFSDDQVTVEGTLDVKRSPLARLLSPLLSLCGALVPHEGSGVPVSVRFYSSPDACDFHFDRHFHFPGRAPYRFHSRMERVEGGDMVEFMRFGLGWRMRYGWDGRKIVLAHRGYVWRVFGRLVPLPLEWVLGSGYAEEEPLSDDSFRMWMAVTHPWFGQTYGYGGIFKVLPSAHG